MKDKSFADSFPSLKKNPANGKKRKHTQQKNAQFVVRTSKNVPSMKGKSFADSFPS